MPNALVSLALAFFTFLTTAPGPLTPSDLRCEYLTSPLGIDTPHPRLSWVFTTSDQSRARQQSAYRILVATSAAKLAADQGDLWDSGEVASSDTSLIEYAGAPLPSRQQCFWKVAAWGVGDESHTKSWSPIATWDMGPQDWHASWIGINMPTPTGDAANPAPFLRRDFDLPPGIKRARLYAAAPGTLELHLNGQKIAESRERDPGYTDFNKRILYITHDVTSLLRPGAPNTLGAILGTGWYDVHDKAVWGFENASWRGRPRMLAMLVVDFDDGHTQTISTDTSWRATSGGPIRSDGIYSGEIYDARLEMPGWDQPNFKDTAWSPADILPAPTGKLTALRCPPIAIIKTITPKAITEPRPGIFIVDMGENFSGHVQLNLQAPPGAKIQLRYSECLAPDGLIDRKWISEFMPPPKVFQEDTYICSGGGGGVETWEQRFSYSGFRYIEVTGFPGKPTLDNFKGRFAATDLESGGTFSCSNDALNQVQQATLQSYLSNAQNIPTDCPTREKNGWTGDAHLAAEAGLLNFRSASFYTKWLDDLKDNQRPDGRLGVIVPSAGWGIGDCQPAWDSAYPLITWYLYQYCGDKRILADHYDHLRLYVDFLTTKTQGGVVTIESTLGDWCPWSTETPSQLTATAFYYEDSRILSQIATILGRPEDAKKYAALAQTAKAGFNAKFFDASTNSYANSSQTALAAPLYFGLVPDDHRAAVLANLAAKVESLKHIDTGILGAKWVPAVLSAGGRNDLAYMLVSHPGVPGWISMDLESKTLWEQWRDPHSRNHIMFGSVSAWFFQSLAGIKSDPTTPGFKRIIIEPHPCGDLTWVKASHDSPQGRITSNWTLQAGVLTMDITIPANTRATIYIPTQDQASITESGQPAASAPAVKFLGLNHNAVAYEVGSGSYQFSAPFPAPKP